MVEDCDVGIDRIREEFGAELANVVWHVTGISTKADDNRQTRVAIDRAHYSKGCVRAQTVKEPALGFNRAPTSRSLGQDNS